MATGMLEGELRTTIARGRAVIVVGSGISVAATKRAPVAGWSGLIRDGIAYATEVRQDLPPSWATSVLEDLRQGEEGYIDGLITAAQKVTRALGGLNHANFRDWLTRAFKDLQVADPAAIEAICALNLPILTTNYDTLIEKVSGLQTLSWVDVMSHTGVFEPGSGTVLHLHGDWASPHSIVFGYDGYERVRGADGPQVLQKVLGLTKSLVFVGCGDGLDDLNVGALRDWLRSNAGHSDIRHYLLCRNPDLESLSRRLIDERIFPVSYGESYSDLPNFLNSLLPSSSVDLERQRQEAKAPHIAITDLSDRVRREVVLGDHMPDLDSRSATELLIPPVLLPVTHEEFARSSSDKGGNRYERCDAEADLMQHRVIVVCGDESSGITSALEWMVARASELSPDQAPVVLDWKQLDSGLRPLQRAIRRYLNGAGGLQNPDAELPDYSVALDNSYSKPVSIFRRVLEDISRENCKLAIFGCTTGVEIEICRRLTDAGVDFALRYVGRLGYKDAELLASYVAPSKAGELSEKALQIIQDEHLPRTPFTLSLLISALLFGEDVFHANSGTALLDAYVNLLLGRGDIHEDARLSIDAHGRATLLAHLAEYFTLQEQGALDEDLVRSFLREFFESRDWSEDAGEVLDNLRSRRVLTKSSGLIKFSQSSYLYLFAAHRAMSSASFKAHLLGRPLYYSPILRHYAALQRDDSDLLHSLDGLLGKDGDLPAPRETVFGARRKEDARGSEIHELLTALDVPELDAGSDDEEDDDSLVRAENVDRNPFPLDRINEAPEYVRLGSVLGLVSTVLRDSDSITNLALKRSVLQRLLLRWGLLAETIYDYDHFRAFTDDLHDRLFDERSGSTEPRAQKVSLEDPSDDFTKDDFAALMSALVAITGISSTLSSRKLMKSLEWLGGSGDLAADPRGASMGAFLALDMQEPGWPGVVSGLVKRHMRAGPFSIILWRVSLYVYYHVQLSPVDEKTLHEFLIDAVLSHRGGKSTPTVRGQIGQRLKQNKLTRSRQRQLGKGSSPFSQEVASDGPGEPRA
ncbi:SIR2 family protein [Geodermatophilus sp. SYSU D00742]